MHLKKQGKQLRISCITGYNKHRKHTEATTERPERNRRDRMHHTEYLTIVTSS